MVGPDPNWEVIARAQLLEGSQQLEARHPEARADPGAANEAGEPQEGDDSHDLHAGLSGALSDISGARDGPEGSVGMLSSPSGERREYSAKRIPLALKLSSRLNIQQSTDWDHQQKKGSLRAQQWLRPDASLAP